MKTAEYDFDLPANLIAERPADRRDHSRLLVLHRKGEPEHRRFHELPRFLKAGDMLILNKTRVFPARIAGHKKSGGRIEILLVKETVPGTWEILAKGKYSGPLTVDGEPIADIIEGKEARFFHPEEVHKLIWRFGLMPLPPYIRRRPDELDRERYQTVYAEVEGSIAAPTAGLHFTQKLLDELASEEILVRFVTLHVGSGTFRPVKTENVEDHLMEREFFEMDTRVVDDIRSVKSRGNRVFAVGTTTTRAIEGYLSGASEISCTEGTIKGTTNIFIREGYTPLGVDCLITNFHLPRSTPLILTSTFAGREKLLVL
jgi:S-adenosylmethionine:tRNA ribosyltransferase-isomerase